MLLTKLISVWQVDFQTGVVRTVEWYKLFFSVIYPGGNVGDNILSVPDPFMTLSGADDEDFETDSNASKATHQVRERHTRLKLSDIPEGDEQRAERSHSI
jgi:hypothetical protein